jgi:hypothetical protein
VRPWQPCRGHDAHALTVGTDIYFGRGEYRPGTERGDELLAHELTHVAQGQRGELTRTAAKGITGGTNLDPSEAEADLRARLAVIDLHAPAGQPPPLASPSGQPTESFQPSADKAQRKADGQKVLDNLPTTSPDVKTDPGPAPVTDLAGQADPVRTAGDHQHAISESAKALDSARQQVVSGTGAAAVQPVKLDEKLSVPKEQAAGAMPQLPTVDGMAKMKKWNLPSNALAGFDTVAKPQMDASLAQGKAKMAEADHKRDADRSKAVSDAGAKVKAAHADADQQQQGKVADARTQISNHQADSIA